MGAKLVKSKSLPISDNDNEVITINSDSALNGSATLEKKMKKKKAKISNKKSLDSKVDKFTSTELNGNSSDYIKHLVNGSKAPRLSQYEARASVSNQSGTPSKDVLELRDACIRRGIISPEMSIVITPAPIEQDVFVEESSNEPPPPPPITVVVTDEQID